MVKTEYEYDSSGKVEKTWVTETYFNQQGYITDEVQYVDNRLNQSIIYKNNSDGLPIKKMKLVGYIVINMKKQKMGIYL